jgi:ABC-type Fe3+ transport system substrate-binding protein
MDPSASSPAWRKGTVVFAAMLITLLGPFLLKPGESTAPSRFDRRLVIVTPHHEQIREEFGRAFVRNWNTRTGQSVFIDWRVPGGTSEIAVMIKSEYTAAFQRHWTHELKRPWSSEAAQAFLSARTPAVDAARAAFLSSDAGIGVDLFFGGGAFDFQLQADAGTLVSSQGPGTGLEEVRRKHPEWFGDAVIPEVLGGEPFRDARNRWCGTCLSSFGIVFNRDVLRRLGIARDPEHWSDLADPRLQGMVALADPGRSSSVTKAFEMLIQQQMQEELARLSAASDGSSPEQVEKAAVAKGWEKGLALIQRISANARYFSDTSTKIPLDVLRGDAAAGMCIDFYGRAAEESVRRGDGGSRVGFVMPVGGTSISVDPIAMMRGAPDPELATAFIEFVLGEDGQKLWTYRPGSPGGPDRRALRRLPVRRDLYTPGHLRFMNDAGEMPYSKAGAFVYHPSWTATAFSPLRFLLRVLCVDTHDEQRRAWRELAAHVLPPAALETFHDLRPVSYDEALGGIAATLKTRDKIAETRLSRQLGGVFRKNYLTAANLAREGR